jgi:hypothetical protein
MMVAGEAIVQVLSVPNWIGQEYCCTAPVVRHAQSAKPAAKGAIGP